MTLERLDDRFVGVKSRSLLTLTDLGDGFEGVNVAPGDDTGAVVVSLFVRLWKNVVILSLNVVSPDMFAFIR